MAKRDYSNFQQGVIRRYYENREQIDEGKLSELVTSLYLAESKSARDKLWDRVESLLERLDVGQSADVGETSLTLSNTWLPPVNVGDDLTSATADPSTAG